MGTDEQAATIPANTNSQQFYTYQSLATLTGATGALTILCGLITNTYKDFHPQHHEIQKWILNSILFLFCIMIVLFFNKKKEENVTRKQYYLLNFFNLLMLYSSVTGATGYASQFHNSAPGSDTPKKETTAGFASALNYLIPTQPLYGVTADSAKNIKDSLVNVASSLKNVNQSLTKEQNKLAITDQALSIAVDGIKKQKDSGFTNRILTAIDLNKNNIHDNPNENHANVPVNKTAQTDILYNNKRSYWVYVGQMTGNTWSSKNFDFKGILKEGDIIKANTAVYKRDSLPVKISGNYWKLGKIIGDVKENVQVKVLQQNEAEGGNFWVLVADLKDAARLTFSKESNAVIDKKINRSSPNKKKNTQL